MASDTVGSSCELLDRWSGNLPLIFETIPGLASTTKHTYETSACILLNLYTECKTQQTHMLQDLVRKLLTVDRKERLTAAQALAHPWMIPADANDMLNNKARRKFRGAIKTVS